MLKHQAGLHHAQTTFLCPALCPHSLPFPRVLPLFFPEDHSLVHQLRARQHWALPSGGRAALLEKGLSDQVPVVRVASLTSIIFFFWHIVGEQEAGTAGHSPGPVVLVLLTTGKGNRGSTPSCPCTPQGRPGWVMGTALGGALSRENWASSPLSGGVGLVAGLCAGEEKKEGASGAGHTGLPPAAPPGGCHTPFTVRGWHEGPPAAAACPAAGAGEGPPPSHGERVRHGTT